MGLSQAKPSVREEFPPEASLMAEVERLKRELAVARARIGELDALTQRQPIQTRIGQHLATDQHRRNVLHAEIVERLAHLVDAAHRRRHSNADATESNVSRVLLSRLLDDLEIFSDAPAD